MRVRAWTANDTEVWLECTLDDPGTDHKSWRAETDCRQRVRLDAGGFAVIRPRQGFVYGDAHDTISPQNGVGSVPGWSELITIAGCGTAPAVAVAVAAAGLARAVLGVQAVEHGQQRVGQL